jgi:FkbM family methyltransferase
LESFPLRVPGTGGRLRLCVHEARDIHISRQIREHGIWEAYETSLLWRFLRPGDCFLDAGANIGYYTVIAAERVGPSGRVLAFEPEPQNFSLLQKNLRLNGVQQRVHARRAALSDRDQDLELHLHADNLGDHQVFPDESGRRVIPVSGLRGASCLADKVSTVNLVKIDTQGAEYHVTRGLMPLLKASGSRLRMIVELTPFSLQSAGCSGSELVQLLQQLDLPFAIIDHIEHRLVPCAAGELVDWCEAVDACDGDRGFMNIFLGELQGEPE